MYKSISDWPKQVKKDLSETWKDGKILDRRPELLILQFANLLLLSTFFYAVMSCASHYIDRINNVLFSTLLFTIILHCVVICSRALNFKVIERFSFLEIFKFELKPSYHLFVLFLILNFFSFIVLKLASVNYLFNNKHVRTK